MARFYSQVDALNYISAVVEASGKVLVLNEVMDTSRLDTELETLTAAKVYDKSQNILLDTKEYIPATPALLGAFSCRILHIFPEAAEYLSSRFAFQPRETGATIIRGRLDYRRPGEDIIRARRLVAHSLRMGAAQLLDAHFDNNAAIPASRIFGKQPGLLKGFATRQGSLEDETTTERDVEMAIFYQALNSYPHLEILAAELGFTATMLPNLADWLREEKGDSEESPMA